VGIGGGAPLMLDWVAQGGGFQGGGCDFSPEGRFQGGGGGTTLGRWRRGDSRTVADGSKSITYAAQAKRAAPPPTRSGGGCNFSPEGRLQPAAEGRLHGLAEWRFGECGGGAKSAAYAVFFT
jgi:hypothetical protein